jgi:predicted amidohydrolase YtcJ
MRRLGIISLCASSTVVVSLFASGNAHKPKDADDGIVIKNVTIISSERSVPLAHASVVIRNGRIEEIGTDLAVGAHAKQIDGRGGFLIPGLIDSHVHVGNMGPLDDDAIEKHPELLEAYRAQLPRSEKEDACVV